MDMFIDSTWNQIWWETISFNLEVDGAETRVELALQTETHTLSPFR